MFKSFQKFKFRLFGTMLPDIKPSRFEQICESNSKGIALHTWTILGVSLSTTLLLQFIGDNVLRVGLKEFLIFPQYTEIILLGKACFLLFFISIIFTTPLFQAIMEWYGWRKLSKKNEWLIYVIMNVVILASLILSAFFFDNFPPSLVGKYYGGAILIAIFLIMIRRFVLPFKKGKLQEVFIVMKLVFGFHLEEMTLEVVGKAFKKNEKLELGEIALGFAEEIAKMKPHIIINIIGWFSIGIGILSLIFNKTKVVGAIFEIPLIGSPIIITLTLMLLLPEIEKRINNSMFKIESLAISVLNKRQSEK